ncbi:hypothetical protein AAGT95_09410 [Salinicola lusitanus]|uniref:Tail fiber protein n=1 Tax=Salinicola lusitanus TaxID=1949085 RepID=A0ABZ3CYU1_9GAMM
MAEVIFPEDLGGDGLVVTDDANPDTGLAAGGHRLRFVPALANTVAVARTAKQQAALAQTLADQVAADRKQTGEDRDAIAGAREATAADRQQTGLDREATKADAEATAADRQQTGEDRQATTAAAEAAAADRQQTGKDRTATAAAAEATAADRQQTGEDRTATNAAAEATAADRQQTGEDRQATAADREAAQSAAASVDAEKIMHARGSGLPNEVGTAATRNVGTEAGNLMEVGAFGVGSHGVRLTDADDLASLPFVDATYCCYSSKPVNAPESGGTTAVISVRATSSGSYQFKEFDYTDNAGRKFNAVQRQNSDTINWIRSVSSATAVGDVSDPLSGAIVESGENENGSYTKFADGTLICRGVDTIPYDTRLRCRLYKTMPAPFANDTGSVCVLPDWGSRGTKFNQAIPAGGLANNGYNAHLAFWAPDTSEFETTDSFPKTAWMAIGIAR